MVIRSKIHTEYPQTLGATIKQKLVAIETWRFGFLQPCYNKGNLKENVHSLPS